MATRDQFGDSDGLEDTRWVMENNCDDEADAISRNQEKSQLRIYKEHQRNI